MPARVRMRWTAYAGVSTALAGFVILKALAQRPNFYSAAVYLSQSSANLMILTNLIFVTACTVLFGLQKLLYGPLRPIEIEQLYEKAWFAVTETCLAMTIFRGEIGPWFLVMFFSLLAGKVWGWIGEGRVEILEQQPPRNPKLFHTRLALSLGLSVAFDVSMLEYIILQVMRMAKPDMMVMFGFEFAILSISSLSTAFRYAIQLFEMGVVREQKRVRAETMRRERMDAARGDLEAAERRVAQPPADTTESTPAMSVEDARAALRRAEQPVDDNEVEVEGWETKGRWVFYLDLATDFFKLVVYLSFFIILLVFYGLPIHIMRDVFLTTRSFFKRISDFMKYRTATRDMNERYPDANADEIGREDVCIICREEMRPYQAPAPGQPPANPAVERMRPKKLPCGHVLHFACLRSWLERQQVCPTCRRSVVPTPATGPTTAVQPGANGQPGQHPPGDRPGPRVYQFGPLRIGVGAARGNNMFEELQQQLADGRAAAGPRGDQNAPQQYGFGIRWDGRHRTRRRHREPQGSLREQLDSVEQQIQQEMQALAQSSREYALLRSMQVELDRVRASRNQTGAQGAAAGVQPAPGLSLPPVRPVQVLQAASGEQLVAAGSDQLPPGLTIPEGWTLMPLRPAAAPQAAGQMPSVMTQMTPQQPVAAPPTSQQPPPMTVPAVPDHIRAMFNLPGQTDGETMTTGSQMSNPVQAPPSSAEASSTQTSIDRPTVSTTAVPTTNGESVPSQEPPVQQNGDSHVQPPSAPSIAAPSAPESLPIWGSPSDAQGNGESSDRQVEAESATNTVAPKSAQEASTSSNAPSKHATVEDMVEDPD
ncbi:uncharacterized protein HMPREF1541_08100 [Cyphellophora europaea CBS 101466]|uniref:RING-type E3 ubiquitin transferase n=1 Tax=Cyphellophora europaea (strain CBS 101466) TaxID=1220924 RepID=W2RLB2_CYPE1|nr:uncharacterized protein HMPREF1541_08100 [Cyphellophora europaea CBS 101466]ETN37110.1 hypothetical protein HMPREF1541_08100 [Cyphellophora europaea CBS 101466]